VANVFLEANGVDLGKKNSDFMNSIGCAAEIGRARKLLAKYGNKIMLPVDVACADQTDPNKRVEMSVSELPTDLSINDIGLETIVSFSDKIRKSQTVIMNGPAGLFENEAFELGTKELVTAAARSKFSIVGGGHIAFEAHALGIESNISHISTGGGACIDFLSGRTLPGIESLVQSYARFKSKLHAVA
ncbi:MAG: phosphoglycerate kinase, partial [Methanosarcinales archaeon]|nr:phosphoglycerate kinase [Methanosarcinales archaeon]